MDEYLWAIPEIIESRMNEWRVGSRVYEDDVLARAELGLKLYEEEDALSEVEKLERVRAAVSADSVSLLDGQGKLFSSTGPVSPEEVFNACVQNLEPLKAHLELYPALAGDGKETGNKDGKLFVQLPLPGNTERSLVFELSCDQLLEMYNGLSNWAEVLERILSEGDAAAYAKTGDKLEQYPLNGLSAEENSQLYEELTKIFRDSGSVQNTEKGSVSRLITLLGRRYLAVLTHYPQESQEDTEILLTIALRNVVKNGVYIAASISAVIGLGIVLIQAYVFRRLLRDKAETEADRFSGKQAIRATWQGILVVLTVTIVFSSMLLLLESRTNISFITKTKRMQIEAEIDWRQKERDVIQSTFAGAYRARAQMLADFLTEHPERRNREGLSELSRIARADYLMLFDSAGQESLIFYAAGFFLIFYILSKFGVNTTALVASAGIISIAVGMGAQSMAADLLVGFFMMLEGTVHVGDRVIVGDFKGSITGVVTDMGIRTIEITEDDGTVSNFNNSKATPLRNLSRRQPSQETKK